MLQKHCRTFSTSSLALSALVLAVGMAGLGYHLGVRSAIDLSATTLRAPVHLARPAVKTAAAAASPAEETNVAAESTPTAMSIAEQRPAAEVTPPPVLSAADAASVYAEVPLHPAAARAPRPLAASTVPQPHWPLVMLDMDMTALGLSPGQQSMVARLREQFIEQVGGKDQDPADPGYLKRWQRAAPAMDEILRAQIGWTAYNAYTLENARARQAAH